MRRVRLKYGISMPPFFYERGYYKVLAFSAFFWFFAGLVFLGKAAWCGYSVACTFTLEDHVLLVLSFAFFNLSYAASLVVYVSSTVLRALNLIEEDEEDHARANKVRPLKQGSDKS